MRGLRPSRSETDRRPGPFRFRRRLTAAFILVAAVTGGVLALISFFTIRQYRINAFRESAEEQVRLSLLSAPTELSLETFGELLTEYQQRAGFETVAVVEGTTYSSDARFGPEDAPFEEPPTADELLSEDVEVDGAPYLAVARMRPDSPTVFYFFFPRQGLLASLTELRDLLALAWAVAVAAAAVFGNFVARRTLRPVKAAAVASQSLAEGLLQTRLPASSADEFGAWTQSFNQMAEALETKIEDLSLARERERQFTADVAHELRTPLAGMVTAASLLADELDRLPAGARRPAGLLVDDVKRLHSLVLELLELARLDAGEGSLHAEPIGVRDAVEAVIRPWAGTAGRFGVSIPPGLTVCADRSRFRRVVANLVSNAVRHGGGDVEIGARREGDSVVIDVCDTGPGLPDGVGERVFDRFYKADTSRSTGGSGLGLAIARQHAAAQGGSLEAANRPGGGARFSFRLPAADATAATGAARPTPEVDASPTREDPQSLSNR
jgi:two-component system sensor histidine kinase MtrB